MTRGGLLIQGLFSVSIQSVFGIYGFHICGSRPPQVVDYAIRCWLNPRMLTRGYRGTTVGLEHTQILVPTADPRTSVPWIGYRGTTLHWVQKSLDKCFQCHDNAENKKKE